MACDKEPKAITIDLGNSGFESEEKAKLDALKAARDAVKAEQCTLQTGCTTKHKGYTAKCVRIASMRDLLDAVQTYEYDDGDNDSSWGWYIDSKINTRCECAQKAEKQPSKP